MSPFINIKPTQLYAEKRGKQKVSKEESEKKESQISDFRENAVVPTAAKLQRDSCGPDGIVSPR